MKDNDSSSRHECLKLRGKGTDCPKCEINRRSFCESLIKTLSKMVLELDIKYTKIAMLDRDAILANTFIGIYNGVNRFEGRNGARFSTWAWRIFLNKRTDYLRQQERQKTINITDLLWDNDQTISSVKQMESGIQPPSEHNQRLEEIVADIIERLKMRLPDDSTGCIRIFLDMYLAFENGKTQKELAEDYGLKPNALTQRIKRCRKTIGRILED